MYRIFHHILIHTSNEFHGKLKLNLKCNLSLNLNYNMTRQLELQDQLQLVLVLVLVLELEQVVTGTRTEPCTRGSTATGECTARAVPPSLPETATRGSGERAPCRAPGCTSSRRRGPGDGVVVDSIRASQPSCLCTYDVLCGVLCGLIACCASCTRVRCRYFLFFVLWICGFVFVLENV